MQKIVTATQAARLLGVTADTLSNWRCIGRGPRFIKTSPTRHGKVLYRASEVEAWLENNSYGSTSEFKQ